MSASGGGDQPRALIALGGNLGDPVDTLSRAIVDLEELGTIEARSSLYRTAPVGGPPGQPDYWNAVAVLRPRPGLEDPARLLDGLLALERRHGRVRRRRWEARILDLDLLDVEGTRRDEAALRLPHPRMMQRAFVLAPLCEVAPEWRHPVTSEGACEALARVGSAGVTRTERGWRPR